MWTMLLMYFWMGSGTPTIVAVPGFKTKDACVKAATTAVGMGRGVQGLVAIGDCVEKK